MLTFFYTFSCSSTLKWYSDQENSNEKQVGTERNLQEPN